MPAIDRDTDEANTPAPGKTPIRSFYYGWVILGVSVATMVATTPGQTFGIAPFTESIRLNLHLSHSQITAAYMLGTLLAAVPLTYFGLLMDRHGARSTGIGVVLLLGVACLLTALANGLFMLFLAFFLLRLTGPGTLSVLSSSTLPFWFRRRLGSVEGVRQLGMAGAIAVVPGMNLWLIERLGWRLAYAVVGLTVCAVMLPLLIFLFRNRPEDVGQHIDGLPSREERDAGAAAVLPGSLRGTPPDCSVEEPGFTLGAAARTRSFWIVLMVNAYWALVATALTFNIVPLFQSQGLGEHHAAAMLTVFAVSLAATYLLGGWLADRVPLHHLLTISTAAMVVSVYCLGSLRLWGLWAVCGVAMGVAQGLSTGITSVICARYFGRLHLGQIRSVLATATIAASSLGPFLVGLTRDLTGGYAGILGIFLITGLAACVAMPFATPPTSEADAADHPLAPAGCSEQGH